MEYNSQELGELLTEGYYTRIINSGINIPEKKYYLYAIVNITDQKVAYIGKGKNTRVLNHFSKTSTSHTSKYINEMREKGKAVEYRIIYETPFEHKALSYEVKLIKHINQFEKLLNIAQSEPHENDLKCLAACHDIMRDAIIHGSSLPGITKACQAILNIAFDEYKRIINSNPTLKGKHIVQNKPLEYFTGFVIQNGEQTQDEV